MQTLSASFFSLTFVKLIKIKILHFSIAVLALKETNDSFFRRTLQKELLKYNMRLIPVFTIPS